MTLWTAPDFDAAILLAEAEAEEYSKDLDCELMRDSEMEPGAYLSAYFDTGDERQQTDQA